VAGVEPTEKCDNVSED